MEFELDGQKFTAPNGGPIFKFNEAISLQVNCETQEEVDYYWEKLSAGGDDNAKQCGWLKDKYGVSWQVVPTIVAELIGDSDSEKSQRAMAALMGMKKLDIAALQRAYDGERASEVGVVEATACFAEPTSQGAPGSGGATGAALATLPRRHVDSCSTVSVLLGESPMKTNVTLKLDQDLLQEARVLAARRGTSVSRLMADQLASLVRGDAAYEQAKARSLARLEKGFDLGWEKPESRDALHDRR